jgi:NAD(P)-dependent dehydrogenase (short-subunit alcohol dehydrogenase family)
MTFFEKNLSKETEQGAVNPFSLKNKVILITGASSGIGRATAIECSKMGAQLIITARNEERLQETFSQLSGHGHEKIIADLTVTEDIDRMVDTIVQLDGLVNNAGIGKLVPIQYIREDELTKTLRINAMAPVLLTQKIYKKKKFKRNASIVFTSSIAGNFCITPGNTMYGMSKSALNAFMEFAALEMSSQGIRCNCINPGRVETPLIQDGRLSEEDRAKDIAKYPLKRYGKPEEIAFGIMYLLSDAASYITGTSLVIDGGLTANG